MKRCPECHGLFDDEQKFCEMHGVPLVDETAWLRDALSQSTLPNQKRDASDVLGTVLIGVLVGVVLSLLVYALLPPSGSTTMVERDKQGSGSQVAGSRSNQLTAAPAPERSVQTPTPDEAEAEIQPSPSSTVPVAPSPEVTAAAVNNGPISTGTKRVTESGQTVIRMKDGSSVEADAAWEDSQGIWYRRGGLVSFVERNRVDKVTAVAEPRPAVVEAPKR
jgi:Zn-finger nucleic acid-binding protein